MREVFVVETKDDKGRWVEQTASTEKSSAQMILEDLVSAGIEARIERYIPEKK